MVRVCKNCGKEIMMNAIVPIIDGQPICMECSQKEDLKEIDTINIPESIVFVSRLAKMGKYRRIIEIPKKQKPFVEDGIEYIIIIKKLEP